ncbi:hypothetical protein CO230_08810 [Chryseobacterium sp. 6424]|uniref:hypothetical protein n=1 Tax=Chryseobacterium sp. 6424 TaxID=2039166 RepID=UPI000EFD8175|nr:hypothetical protein [Chryseobacterium sp. 6424]AYO58215.1 hypothetical protein CO230_08810 [Chryseobacterium sp. 6424]
MNKALSSSDLLAKKYKLFDFTDDFLAAFDRPEKTGTWFVYGNSGNGKTNFLLQLIKELAKTERVLYNSLEEGDAHTMQKAWMDNNMQDCGRRVQLICETMEELKDRLRKRQSPNVIVVDSFQYTWMNFKEYMALKNEFKNKLFIYNSQCEGKSPMGKTAMKVMYDASLKIWIEGFKAFSKGRYIGKNGGEYVIWDEGAEKYWGNKK